MGSLFVISVLVSIMAAVLAGLWCLGYQALKPLDIYEKKYPGEIGQGLHVDVTDEKRNLYRTEGYTVLRNVLPQDWVDHLLNISKTIEWERAASNRLPTNPRGNNCLYSNWPENSAVRQFWMESGIAEVVAKTVGAEKIRLFEDILITANIRNDHMVCWHADTYSFGSVVEPWFTYSVWIPLVEITREKGGTLQICNRSTFAQLPKYCDVGVPGAPALVCGLKGLEEREQCEPALRKTCEIPDFRPGDAVIFAKDTIHRQFEVFEPSFRRPVFIGRFVDAQATYKTRKGTFLNSYTYKVQHDMCNHGLQTGDIIKGPCFPLVYPQIDATEATSERQYLQPNLVAGLAMLEDWWYGGQHVVGRPDSMPEEQAQHITK
eukprot:gnl/MRDRNA2_/MRDRNA2_85694_c0_seq1.p1 gnl/MRDRNA2_/MRDRNA2_85694_c0~~gnl/MRDRNA2_/MRDRNA2_85694_c0_seq1.p1  ORF type:complete len:376 (+),score=29.50 gnl/MRDRNA2_/MRDRNA2_85694_c0_seq1:63-1190(+)